MVQGLALLMLGCRRRERMLIERAADMRGTEKQVLVIKLQTLQLILGFISCW